jgi:hypothetical protein
MMAQEQDNKISDQQRRERDLDKRVAEYKDIDGVSTKILDIGAWYLAKRQLFFLGLVWTLSLAAVVLWSYSLYVFGYYLLVGIEQDRVTEATLADPGPMAIRRNLTEQFSYDFKTIIGLGANRYDFIGLVNNQNPMAWARFNYYFLLDGQRIADGSSFIMPASQKYISGLVDNWPTVPEGASMVVTDLQWTKISPKQIADWPAFNEQHLNFTVRDQKFTSAVNSALSEKLPLNIVSFKVTNDTSFNYLEAPFQVALYSGNQLVAIKNYVINKFLTRASKEVQMTIIGNLPNVTKIEVEPDINILDPNVYLNSN